MRVPVGLSLAYMGQEEAAPQAQAPAQAQAQAPADPAGVLEVKFLQLTADLDNRTPSEAFAALREIQRESLALEQQQPAKPIRQKLRGIRFGASKAAANLWRAMTPEGREATRAAAKAVVDKTPPLRHALEKDEQGERAGIKYDPASEQWILPNGKVAPGRRLGQEKQRLGWNEADHARRREIMSELRKNRVHVKSSEKREALDQTRTKEFVDKFKHRFDRLPAHVRERVLERVKGRGPAAAPAPAPVKPGMPGKPEVLPPPKGKPLGYFGVARESGGPGLPMSVLDRLALQSSSATAAQLTGYYLGQATDAVEAYVADAEQRFPGAELEDQIAILDKVSDISSALNAQEAGNLTADDVASIAGEREGEFPLGTVLLIGGGVLALGLVLYFLLKK